jgi:pyrimidine operon attenuation protein / uracil phosphoribosyltransferase
MLSTQLKSIAPFAITLVRVDLNKVEPLSHPINVSPESTELEGKCVIVVDDVLNTGRTLAFSLRPFLRTNVKRLQVAVLVDRGYKLFPVAADYVGYALSTTLQEHIEVSFEGDSIGVFLK